MAGAPKMGLYSEHCSCSCFYPPFFFLSILSHRSLLFLYLLRWWKEAGEGLSWRWKSFVFFFFFLLLLLLLRRDQILRYIIYVCISEDLQISYDTPVFSLIAKNTPPSHLHTFAMFSNLCRKYTPLRYMHCSLSLWTFQRFSTEKPSASFLCARSP